MYEKAPLPFVILPFVPYRDEYTPFNKVQPRLECGTFKVDPYNANNLRMAGQPLGSIPALKGPAAIRVYPNPVHDQLYIDYGVPKNKGRITAGIYGYRYAFAPHICTTRRQP